VEDHVILGGFAGVFQFCRLGVHSFICANAVVTKDVLPYTLVSGIFAEPHGLNKVGLKRRGFSEETQRVLLNAYKIIYRQDLSVSDAIAQLQVEFPHISEVSTLIAAMQRATLGFCR
jgi:UDP-N-acetylglucosamine acyltransferase